MTGASATLGSTRAPFAVVRGVALSGRPGLGIHRILISLSLEIPARKVDPSDSDRVLISTGLAGIDGDLFVRSEGEERLLGAPRHLAPPLPLAQQLGKTTAQLQLFLDLGTAQGEALARLSGELVGVLRLRGVCEHWENPLFDEDGYQRMRVGDSGLSRALQAIGQVERLPLVELVLEFPWVEADLRSA